MIACALRIAHLRLAAQFIELRLDLVDASLEPGGFGIGAGLRQFSSQLCELSFSSRRFLAT